MYTLKSLLEQRPIVIPMIQRDYAQGRNDEHATRIRREIVRQLKRATLRQQHVDFDFIYGTVRNSTLHPLDGQQRLTTLFLLYWYIGAFRVQKLPSYLSRFSYETRISARNFFEAIQTQRLVIIEEMTLSALIKTQKWFQEEWLQDPTVQGALVMIDTIHEEFLDVDNVTLPDLESIEPDVTFQFLDLDQFHLDESLYIKMNSRGKPLTTFEHFKAQFERMLDQKGWLHEKEEFSTKIEKEWSDLLWPYRDKETQTIDEAFLNLYRFITSTLFFETERTFEGEQKDFFQALTQPELFENVYSDRKTLQTLFQTLNAWPTADALESHFKRYTTSIPLLNPNIVNQLIQGSLSNEEQFIVYMIIRLKHRPIDDEIQLVRIVRNLIEGIRQNNQGVYNSNLRFDMFKSIYKQLNQLLDSDAPVKERFTKLTSPFSHHVVYHEIEKQDWIGQCEQRQRLVNCLEDSKVLKGLTHRVFPSVMTHGQSAVDVILQVLEVPSSLVSRAMLAIGDYNLIVGNSNRGPRYVFGGSKFRKFVWTNQMDKKTIEIEKQLQLVIDTLVTRLLENQGTIEKRLECIIAEHANTKQDWRYYLTQYEHILTDHGHIFIFNNENTLQFERLNGVNLQGSHSNPIYIEVARCVTDLNASVEYYGDLSRLEFKGHELNQKINDFGEWEIYGSDVPNGWKNVLIGMKGDMIQKGIVLAKWVKKMVLNQEVDTCLNMNE